MADDRRNKATGGISLWEDPNLQAERRIPSPSFTRSEANPVFTASDTSWGVSSDEIHWPQVIRTEQLPDPEGAYYMYYAPHDVNGIGVAYADHPEGPWTDHPENPVIPSGGEPGVCYHAERGEVWVYYNRPNPEIHLVRSSTGLDEWTDEGVVFTQEREGHMGYPRVLQTAHGIYHTTWQTAGEKASPVIRHSRDGMTDWSWIQPAFGERRRPTGDFLDLYHDGITMLPYRNGYYCMWDHHRRPDDRDIMHGFTTDGIRIQEHGIALGGGGQAWEENCAATPELVWGDEKLWMFYTASQPTGTKIGVASADSEGRRP